MEFKGKEQLGAFLVKAVEAAPTISPLRGIRPVSAGEYAQALHNIEASITENQRKMLLGHALAPQQTQSMSQLAAIADYPDFQAANSQYGKLGRKLVNALGIPPPKFLVYAMASFADDPDAGKSRAHMYPELLDALRLLGWIPADLTTKEPDDFVDESLTSTERLQLSAARIGQGQFRTALLALWKERCALTGCSLLTVLVASHIKPWAKSSNAERLDPYNGLLLSGSADRLFDQGLISFTDSGQMLVKHIITDEQLASIGLSRSQSLSQIKPAHQPYLAAHRTIYGF